MSKITYWSTRNGRNLRVMQTLLNRGHEEPYDMRVSRPVVCPAKAGMFSRSQSC